MKKRLLSLILCSTVTFFGANPVYAVGESLPDMTEEAVQTEQMEMGPLLAEANIVASGTCGENLTWTLDDEGTLIISGTGEMMDYGGANGAPWKNVEDVSILSVVIEDGVTSIGNASFSACGSLESVNIGNSVTSIGNAAFVECFALKSVEIPDSVTSIENSAFYFCGLRRVKIGNSVTSIEGSVFADCCALESIEIPASVTSIGGEAFGNCSSLTEIYFKGTLPQIESNSFEGVTATAYHPNTWETIPASDAYGGNLTWVAYEVSEENLAAPEIVSVYSKVQTSVKITWNEVDGADGYQLYRSESANGTYSLIKTITDSSTVKYTNSGLTVGQTYYYKVRAFALDNEENRIYSDFSEVRYMPAAVIYEKVYSNSTNRIRILWNEVDGAEGYQLWRSDRADGTYKIVKTINDGATTAYSNTGLTSGETYCYKMRAFTTVNDQKVFGAYSDVVTVAVMPEIPELTVASTAVAKVRLNWNQISGAAGYQICRSDMENGTFEVIKSITDGSTLKYTNAGLTSGNTYYYKVRAYTEVDGKKTFGGYSEIKNIQVK